MQIFCTALSLYLSLMITTKRLPTKMNEWWSGSRLNTRIVVVAPTILRVHIIIVLSVVIVPIIYTYRLSKYIINVRINTFDFNP